MPPCRPRAVPARRLGEVAGGGHVAGERAAADAMKVKAAGVVLSWTTVNQPAMG